MLKRTLLILACACSCITAVAQADLTTLCAQYEANKRDLNAAKEYAAALEQAGKGKEAEAVVREYMGRCPVLQIEDKDTYLFINRYVFENPYSNVFDYGIYAIKKMKWDRMEEVAGDVAGDKVARLKNLTPKEISKGLRICSLRGLLATKPCRNEWTRRSRRSPCLFQSARVWTCLI